MSVLTCSRARCENIMCDRYSPTHGYICESCFQELVSLGEDTNIEEFLRSDPKEATDKDRSLRKWDAEFPER